MSQSVFTPYGLVRNQTLHRLYQQASVLNASEGVSAPVEEQTLRLLDDMFYAVLFKNDRPVRARPTVPRNTERFEPYDLLLDYPDQGGTDNARTVCFVEAKRSPFPMTSYDANDLGRIEERAVMECKAYLRDNPQYDFVYAMTASGTRVRLWKYSGAYQDPHPCWGRKFRYNAGAKWSDYRDIGVDADAIEIVTVLLEMCRELGCSALEQQHLNELLFELGCDDVVNSA